MTQENDNRPIDFSEYLPLADEIIYPGSQLTVTDIWVEDKWIYCTLLDKKNNGEKDFEILATLEDNGEVFLVIGDTPNYSIDSPIHTYSATKIISHSTLELVSKQKLDSISQNCLTVLKQNTAAKIESLKKVFGDIREYDDPK